MELLKKDQEMQEFLNSYDEKFKEYSEQNLVIESAIVQRLHDISVL
jgi:hypothetical protein